ncbi:uncharacterized protein LOC116342858 [Contarinia nasturtii]|uniref:uncharacterized protein LOC116342858 n=1 Tax=Contarinia nasturtii TaxID=265458 RepID=UPI0012D48BA6|nr:uncharacterized protein LOC116342858 [Contarinia nasturtii]
MSPSPAKQRRRRLLPNRKSKESATNQLRGPLTRSRARAQHIVIENLTMDQLPQRLRKKNRVDKLTDLNDDCLLSILEHMNPVTLTTFAETSDRMNGLARYHFRLKYKCFDFISLIGVNNEVNYGMAKQLFKIFGDLMTSLNLARYLFANQNDNLSYDLLNLIKHHCCNLKTLKLEDIFIETQNMQKLNALFEPIETLVLDNCSFQQHNIGFGNMKHLKKLKMSEFNCSWKKTIGRNFEELEQIEFDSCHGLLNEYLETFIKANQMLKSLTVTECMYVTSNVFSAISSLKQLEEFEFKSSRLAENTIQTDLMHLAALKNLKVLNLDCMKSSVAQLLQNLVKNSIQIEHLELANGTMNDDTLASINKMKTIKILKLNEIAELTENQVVGFTKELNQLEQLHIKTNAKVTKYSLTAMVQNAVRLSCIKIDSPALHLDTYTYDMMLASIRKRDENIKLDLTIYGNCEQILVPEIKQLNDQNDRWFCVKELDRTHNHVFPKWSSNGQGSDDEEDDEFFDDDDELAILFSEDEEDFDPIGFGEVPSDMEISDSDADVELD